MKRRHFLRTSLAGSAAALLHRPLLRMPLRSAKERGSEGRRILVLGGTVFLGPALVEAAVVAGHTVTLFNRGITNPELFPHLEKLRGLRSAMASEENLTSLRGRQWDAIVDVWPSDPVLAESAAR